MTKDIKKRELLYVIAGSIIFSLGCNLFVVPAGVYNGGIVGTSQVLRSVFVDQLHLTIGFDIAGIINMLINVPLLLIAFKVLRGPFVYKTIMSVAIQTVAFSLIPTDPIIEDQLASLIIGALISGFGAGLVLTARASAGGNDVTGMLMMTRNPNASVGKVNLIYNVVLYVICALLFDIETAIYSVLQAIIFSIAVDRTHLQNIEVSLMIFTKNKDVKQMIIKDQHRGVTYWRGKGAYTDEDTDVLVTIVSKYEVNDIRKKVKEMDAHAFVICYENLGGVDGNVEKRLI